MNNTISTTSGGQAAPSDGEVLSADTATAMKPALVQQELLPSDASVQRLVMLPLDRIKVDSHQPRKDLGDLSGLAVSIQQQGLLNPLIVEQRGKARYRIISGERRLAACRQLQLQEVSCIVRSPTGQQKLEWQLIENLQRKDLNPVEQALGLRRLIEEFHFSQRDLAARLGLSTATINETLRILSLREDLLANVRTSEHLTKSVLLEIAKHAPEKQKSLLAKARKGHLTVRSARQAKRSDPDKEPRKGKAPSSDAGTTKIATQPQTVGEQLRVLWGKATPLERMNFLVWAQVQVKTEDDNRHEPGNAHGGDGVEVALDDGPGDSNKSAIPASP